MRIEQNLGPHIEQKCSVFAGSAGSVSSWNDRSFGHDLQDVGPLVCGPGTRRRPRHGGQERRRRGYSTWSPSEYSVIRARRSGNALVSSW